MDKETQPFDELRKLQGFVENKDGGIVMVFTDDKGETREQTFTREQIESQFFKMELFIEGFEKELKTKELIKGKKLSTDKQKEGLKLLNNETKKKVMKNELESLYYMRVWREYFIMALNESIPDLLKEFDENYPTLIKKYKKLLISNQKKGKRK